jgi:tetratricopeptide (TPR) repeat protein
VANNRKRDARDAYVVSLKYGKDNYKIWERIILFDFDLKDFEAMLKHSEQAVELFPNQALMWFYNGSAKIIKQNYEDAIISLEQARMFSSSNTDLQIEIYARLGDAYNATKEYAKSDKAYDKVLEFNPDNLDVLNNYSYYLALRKEKLELAKKMSTRLLALTPNSGISESYVDTYSWVLFSAGEYENAKIQLEKIILKTQNATILEHYGDVLFKLGQIDSAIEQWKKAKQNGGEVSNFLDRKINEKKLIE